MFIYEKSLYLLNVELKGLEGRHYLKEKKKKLRKKPYLKHLWTSIANTLKNR